MNFLEKFRIDCTRRSAVERQCRRFDNFSVVHGFNTEPIPNSSYLKKEQRCYNRPTLTTEGFSETLPLAFPFPWFPQSSPFLNHPAFFLPPTVFPFWPFYWPHCDPNMRYTDSPFLRSNSKEYKQIPDLLIQNVNKINEGISRDKKRTPKKIRKHSKRIQSTAWSCKSLARNFATTLPGNTCAAIDPMVCSHCCFQTSSATEFQFHCWSSHGKHICILCGRTFAQKANRDRHMCLHTGARPYPCDLCGEKFSRGDKLKIHKSRNHGVIR